MLTGLTVPGPADTGSLVAGLIVILGGLLLPLAIIRISVWIEEGMPGVSGRLAADRRRPSTACPTSPDTTHGVAR